MCMCFFVCLSYRVVSSSVLESRSLLNSSDKINAWMLSGTALKHTLSSRFKPLRIRSHVCLWPLRVICKRCSVLLFGLSVWLCVYVSSCCLSVNQTCKEALQPGRRWTVGWGPAGDGHARLPIRYTYFPIQGTCSSLDWTFLLSKMCTHDLWSLHTWLHNHILTPPCPPHPLSHPCPIIHHSKVLFYLPIAMCLFLATRWRQ